MYVDIPPNAKLFGKFVRIGLKLQAIVENEHVVGLRFLDEDFYFFEMLNIPGNKVFEVITAPNVTMIEKALAEGVILRIFKDDKHILAVLLTDTQQLLDVLLLNRQDVEVNLYGECGEDHSAGCE